MYKKVFCALMSEWDLSPLQRNFYVMKNIIQKRCKSEL